MATVFLSYDHDDVERAAPIAAALEKAGHSVWWDRHIHGGAAYNDEIETAVEEANAVVVLWSKRSVRSTWVRDEAAEGRDQNKLVPVLLDAVKPPMGFRQFQTIDCTRSNRGPSSSSLQQILNSIDRVSGATQAGLPQAPARPSKRFDWFGRRTGLAAAALLLLIIGALGAWKWSSQPALPVVVVAPADTTARSRALSDDLFVKLGTLEHVASGKWQLAESKSVSSDPDLLFKVAATGAEAAQRASLVLLDGRHNNLLWSHEFGEAGGSEADVREQLAMQAGIALTCALEARENGGLPPDLSKRYLTACTEAAVSSDMEPDKLVAAMRSIIAARPDFRPAWSGLLAGQSAVTGLAQLGGAADAVGPRRTLRNDIENARKVAPDLPEIRLVEIQLLSPLDFAGRLALIAEAKAQAPDRAGIWAEESTALESVGRMTEAVASARRAADLEPLASGATYQVIMALAHAGEIEAAKKELGLAERKWAGTDALADAQWAFHMRFGNPKIAMTLREAGPNLYLQARLEPTRKNIDAMITEIERSPQTDMDQVGYAIQAFAEFDQTDKVYDWLGRAPPDILARYSYLFFRPAFDDVRRDYRFMPVMQRIGLLSYWQKTGKWPDFCYDPKLPYECKKEAAKLAA